MRGEGGTPSVSPVSVDRYAGLPPTRTFSDHDPGNVATTAVHGFVAGVGGCAQPAITAPMMSGTHMIGEPWMSTLTCVGISITRPPCAHMTVALLVRMGGTVEKGSSV